MMEVFFTVLVSICSFTILLTWFVVSSIEIDQEHALYDKNNVKYTDGDNT